MKQILRNKDTGNFLIRYWKSFLHALDGLRYAFKYEHNMYIIALAIFVVVFCGCYFKITLIELLFCVFSMGIVMIVELINSALEAVCDLVTLKENVLVKIAKDTASSASLICCITAAIVGLSIFVPKIFVIFE